MIKKITSWILHQLAQDLNFPQRTNIKILTPYEMIPRFANLVMASYGRNLVMVINFRLP